MVQVFRCYKEDSNMEYLVLGVIKWCQVFSLEDIESFLVLEHDLVKNYSICKAYHKSFMDDKVVKRHVNDHVTFTRLYNASSWFKVKTFLGHGFHDNYYKTIKVFIDSLMKTTDEIKEKDKIRMLKDFVMKHNCVHNMMSVLDDVCEEVSHALLTAKKARVIQNVWRKVVSDPNHIVCQKRLMREWDEFEFNS